MVPQVMATLAPKPGERVADCTLGYGGHALEFLGHVGPTGHVHGFDVDGRQLQTVRGRLGIAHPNLHFHRSNFAGLGKVLATEGLDGFDVIFADLGVSSMQIDEPGRGFSYKHDGPLDMRMDERIGRTAADLLATMGAAELSTALAGLADEPRHERIAQAIVQTRTREPILRTGQLVRVIFEAVGLTKAGWKAQRGPTRVLHPAARTFQALRILVNDELGSLRHLLRIAPSCLRPGGRIGILSFHSGEHDLVQNAFDGGLSEGLYEATCPEPLRPSPQERFDNPRSSAARLRWAKRPAS